MKHMYKELFLFKWALLLLFITVVGSVAANLALPMYLSEVINTAIPNGDKVQVVSIGGTMLLFVLLAFRLLKVEHIREKSDFLLANMAFFFVPAGVSIINYFEVLQSTVWKLLIICLLTTILTFAATAGSIRLTLKLMALRKGGNGNG